MLSIGQDVPDITREVFAHCPDVSGCCRAHPAKLIDVGTLAGIGYHAPSGATPMLRECEPAETSSRCNTGAREPSTHRPDVASRNGGNVKEVSANPGGRCRDHGP